MLLYCNRAWVIVENFADPRHIRLRPNFGLFSYIIGLTDEVRAEFQTVLAQSTRKTIQQSATSHCW